MKKSNSYFINFFTFRLLIYNHLFTIDNVNTTFYGLGYLAAAEVVNHGCALLGLDAINTGGVAYDSGIVGGGEVGFAVGKAKNCVSDAELGIGGCFENIGKECVLYVPRGAKRTYEKMLGWNNFAKIVEMDM